MRQRRFSPGEMHDYPATQLADRTNTYPYSETTASVILPTSPSTTEVIEFLPVRVDNS